MPFNLFRLLIKKHFSVFIQMKNRIHEIVSSKMRFCQYLTTCYDFVEKISALIKESLSLDQAMLGSGYHDISLSLYHDILIYLLRMHQIYDMYSVFGDTAKYLVWSNIKMFDLINIQLAEYCLAARGFEGNFGKC